MLDDDYNKKKENNINNKYNNIKNDIQIKTNENNNIKNNIYDNIKNDNIKNDNIMSYKTEEIRIKNNNFDNNKFKNNKLDNNKKENIINSNTEEIRNINNIFDKNKKENNINSNSEVIKNINNKLDNNKQENIINSNTEVLKNINEDNKKNNIINYNNKEIKTKINLLDNSNINSTFEEKKIKMNNNNIIISHINIPKKTTEFNNFSYLCLTDKLKFSVNQGTKNAKFDFILKNNGIFPWPKNETFLIPDPFISDINVDKIKLEPLNPGEKHTFSINLKDLEKLEPGKYNIYLEFNAKNKNFGEKILITFEILKKQENKAYDPKIAAFRNMFKIDEKTMSDEVIKKALDKYNNDFNKAFESMFQN